MKCETCVAEWGEDDLMVYTLQAPDGCTTNVCPNCLPKCIEIALSDKTLGGLDDDFITVSLYRTP